MKVNEKLKYFAIIFTVLFILLAASGTINTGIVVSSLTGSLIPTNFISGIAVPESTFIGGLTPLSISNVDFFNTDSVLQAKTIALFFRTGGLGGWTKGDFSSGVINQQLGSDGQVSKGFTFKAGLTSERCFYPFNKDNSLTLSGVLRRYEYKEFNICPWGTPNCVYDYDITAWKNRCVSYVNSVGGQWLFVSKANLETKFICVYGMQDGGHLARILTPNYLFTLHSELTIDNYTSTADDTLSANVGTDSSKTSTPYFVSGNQVGYLLWNGNLGTGSSCATVDVARKYLLNTSTSDSSSSWRIVDSTLVQDYYSKEQTLRNKADSMQAGAAPIQQVVDAIVQVNNAHNNLQNNTTNTLENNVISYASKSGYDGALYYSPTKPIAFPTFTLYVKADKLGFVQPQPQVSNLKVQAQSGSKSGDLVPLLITWTNSGQTGNFGVSVSCSGVYRSVDGSREVSASTGGNASTSFNIQGTCSSNQTGSCTVTVTPISAFGGLVVPASKQVNLSCSPEIQCIPNTNWCISNTVLKSCNSLGQFGGTTDCASQNKICANGGCQATQNRCGDTICDLGEQLTCAQDCVTPPVPPVPPLTCAIDEHLVVSNTPVWWSLGLIKETKTYCEKDFNYALVVLIIVAGISVVAVALIFKGKKKGRR